MTLTFTDPIAARVYLEQWAGKSVNPVDFALWIPKGAESDYDTWDAYFKECEIRPLTLEELNPELLPELFENEYAHIKVDASVYVKGYQPQKRGDVVANGGVLIMTHDQSPEQEEANVWGNSLVLGLLSDDALTKLINQLTIQADFAFAEKRTV